MTRTKQRGGFQSGEERNLWNRGVSSEFSGNKLGHMKKAREGRVRKKKKKGA